MADFKKDFSRKVTNPADPSESYMLKLTPGYTAIVHADPKLRTDLLNQIHKHAKNADFIVYYYDAPNTFRYGMPRSTSELIFAMNKRVNDAKYLDRPLCVMLDRPDFLMTLPELVRLGDHLDAMCSDIRVKADGSADWPIYVVASVDRFELAKRLCVNPENGRTKLFSGYREYAYKLLHPGNED